MSVLDIIFNRKSVYGLRKEYDKIREKADREPDMNRRLEILRLLDSIEPTLVSLEEHIMSGFEKKRMIRYIGQNLKKAKHMLKDKDYFRPLINEQARRF